MRIALVRSLFVLLTVVLPACGGDDAPEIHVVRGRVAAVLEDGRQLVIDHEDIPGFMKAMQMNLPVRDPAQARDLAPGQKVQLELHVGDRGFWVAKIERLPDDTALSLAADAGP